MEPQDVKSPTQPDSDAPPSSSSVASPQEDSIKHFVTEARSIQELLHTYRERNEALKDDLAGFVHREIDEQAKLSHLRASVDQVELASLRDARYLEYVVRRKEQQAEDAPFDATTKNPLESANAVPRDQSVVGSEATRTSSGEVWWIRKLQETNSEWLRKWLPDGGVLLCSESAITQVWQGWKTANQTSTEAFRNLVSSVYLPCATGPSSTEKRLSLFGNGFLCTIPAEVDVNVLAHLEAKTRQVTSETMKSLSGRGDEFVSSDSLVRRVPWAAYAYSSALYDAVAMSRVDFTNCLWPKADLPEGGKTDMQTIANELRLGGDEHDTLTFVAPARLQNTVTVRAFFFQGEVGLVEQLGAEVDLTALFFPSSQTAPVEKDWRACVRSSILRTLRALHAALAAQNAGDESAAPVFASANLVLTVALRLPLSEGSLSDGVLLDVHPVTPQLPFEGRTTWMEVCAVGRQREGARAGDENCRNLNKPKVPAGDSSEGVVFRLTYLPVGSLQPYDAVSRRIFPLLNEAMKPPTVVPTDANTLTGDKLNKDGASLVTAAALCVATISCVALAFGVVRWARR